MEPVTRIYYKGLFATSSATITQPYQTHKPRKDTLEGNNNLRNTDYTHPAAQVNQGIIDGRPEGL
jgi:hypothetical protein